jgi:Do/DeqQ family serine protease
MTIFMRLSRLLFLPVALLVACSPQGGSNAQTTSGATHSLGGPAAELAAPNRAPPPDFATMKMSFSPIVKRAAPAVVNVFSQRVVRTQVDPFWQFFGGGMGVPQSRVEGSLGSGVIVRSDGLIVTNNHVIEGGTELNVVLADRREFPAKVILADSRADLAVLKIDVKGERLPVLPIADRDSVQVGDLVLAIGDPFGVGQTVTNGIVSALARTDVGSGANDFSYFIQTDAAINPGNSGGPLVDMDGNLIGLNTLIYSRTGSSAGIGFAIPAAMVRRVVETAVGGGHAVNRPWLGAKTQTVDSDAAKSLGLDRAGGAMVVSVYPGGPAAQAGLGEGDVIVSADGQPVTDEGVLNYRVATHKPGESMSVQIRKGGGLRTVQVRLDAPPSTPARDERTLSGREPLAGATVVNLSPAVAEEYGLDPMLTGVLIIKPGQNFAAQAGFQAGDIIREVNGRAVRTTTTLAAALQAAEGWRITVERGGREITASFGL